jgi:hypothetical protein
VPTIFTDDSSLCLNTVEPKIQGSIFFFTVVLAERSSNLLVEQIGRLRQVAIGLFKKAVRSTQSRFASYLTYSCYLDAAGE